MENHRFVPFAQDPFFQQTITTPPETQHDLLVPHPSFLGVPDVRDAYLAEGTSRERAVQASESWLIIRSGARGDLAFGDEILADFASGRLRRRGRGLGT